MAIETISGELEQGHKTEEGDTLPMSFTVGGFYKRSSCLGLFLSLYRGFCVNI